MGFDDLFDRGHHQRYDRGHNDHHNNNNFGFNNDHHNDHHNDHDFQTDHHYDQGFRNNYQSVQDTRFIQPYSSHPRPDMKRMLMDKLSNNPQLKSLLIIAAVIVIVVLIILAIILVPLLLKFAGYVGEEGIQGLLNNIWKGSK